MSSDRSHTIGSSWHRDCNVSPNTVIRHYAIAIVACALAIAALWPAERRDPGTTAAETQTGAATSTLTAADRLSGPPSSALATGLSFEQLPSSYRPAQVQRVATDLHAWLLESNRNRASPELLAVDCTLPPCVVELDYDLAVGGEAFVEQLVAALPTRSALDGLQTEQLDRPASRRRLWLYWSPPGHEYEAMLASARTRIAASRAALGASR